MSEITEWISVDDGLPSEDCYGLDEGIEDVLICYNRICTHCSREDGLYISIGYYFNDSWKLAQPLSDDVFTNEHNIQINVLYWMLLPCLPKQKI